MAKAPAAEAATSIPHRPAHHRLVILAALWLLGSHASGQASESSFEVAPKEVVVANAPCAYAHNQGVDLIAEYLDEEGTVVRRSGSWLGRDGRYLLPAPGNSVTRVRFRALDTTPAELSDVKIFPCPTDLPDQGMRALASALDTRLAVYLGQATVPDNLGEQFLDAIEAFRDGSSSHWEAVAHFEYASLSRSLDQLETAAAHYEASRQVFDLLDDPRGEAAAWQSLSLVAMRQGDSDRSALALEHAISLFEALDDWQSLAGASNNLGLLMMGRGQLEAAAFHLEQSLTLRSGPLNLRAPGVEQLSADELQQVSGLTWALNSLNNLALVRQRQGAVHLAEQYWRNYLALSGHIDRNLGIAQVRHNLGGLMLEQGRLDEALVLLGQALEQFSASDARRWLVETRVFLSLLYHRLGDQELALEHARKALELSPEDLDARVRAHRHAAEMERHANRPDAALSLYDQALTLLEEQQEGTERWITESERGHLLLLKGESEQARTIQQRILDAIPVNDQLALAARVRYRLALTWLHDESPDRAEALLETALKQFQASEDVYYELLTLEALADLHASNAQARHDFSEQAVDRVFNLKRQPLADLRRVGLGATLKRVEDQHIRLLLSQGRTDEAWALAERIRSSSLFESRRARMRLQESRERRVLLDEHAVLIDRLHQLRLTRDATTDEVADLRLRIDRIETRLHATSTLMQQAQPVDRELVRASLGENQLLLSYYQLPERMLLWATTKESLRFVAIEDVGKVSRQVDQLLAVLRHPRHAVGAIDHLARELGERLLSPVTDLIETAGELLIQPHGELHMLPFAVLIHDDQVLIDRWSVRQVLSAQPSESPVDPTSDAPRSLLVLADPGWELKDDAAAPLPNKSLVGRLMRDGLLARLPGTAREADALAELDSTGIRVSLRTGRQASRRFLIDGGMGGHSLVHFATHGLVDMRFPELSALLLADEGGSGPDLLRPHEIAGLDMDARLVVLSGCETGAGPIQAGDGALSLARPFLIAGAGEVVSTIWKIDDARTADLMAAFYRHLLRNGGSAADALAAAQRELRHERTTAHPFYWAGFAVTSLELDP